MKTTDSRRSVSISIDLRALRSNIRTARHCAPDSRLFATIKADAYGHGAVEVARALSPVNDELRQDRGNPGRGIKQNEQADGFAVVTLDEALELRNAGVSLPILVLQGPQSNHACIDMVRESLWPVIHDLQQYAWYRQSTHRDKLCAWLKVDTGMGRLGVQADEARRLLSADDGIQWMGLLTHFACADETENPYTLQQLERFNTVTTSLSLVRSLANSAGVLAWPQTHADWARPGIMLYGCNPLDRALPESLPLRPVMTVTAPLISVKTMEAGASIGYGRSWYCPEQMPIGYVAFGYRDGLPRVLDKTASVTIQGQVCPIVGRVSMDSIAVDLRPLPNAQLGESAELWGAGASVDTLASAAGTISYELLTSVRGSRNYINDLALTV